MKKIYFPIFTTLLLLVLSMHNLNAAIYNLKAGGNITTPADWGTFADGIGGTHPANFTGSNTWNLATNNAALTLSSTWTVANLATVNFGTGSSNFVFTLSGTGLVGNVSSAPKMVIANQCTMNINGGDNFNPAALKTIFNTGSTVIYGTGATTMAPVANAFYDLIINTSLSYISFSVSNDLTINSSASFNGSSISVARDMYVNAACDLGAGSVTVGRDLIMAANITMSQGAMALGGTISGAGSFVGDQNGSSLSFSGTGSVGTLNLLPPFQLSSLSLGLGSAASVLTLSGDLFIDGGLLQLSAGALDLNGNVLSVENTSSADFSGGGTIIGSAASTLSISASAGGAGIAGSLLMDATNNNLKALVLNSNGETLTLGSQLNILDFLQVDDGTLVTGGNLTLKASNLLSARVGSIGATGAISGNVTVETFIPGNATGWSLWGANGVNGLIVDTWNAEIPMTCENCLPYGVTGAGGYYFESVQAWSETVTTSGQEYDTSIVAGTNLTPGRGFWVYVGSGQSLTSDYTLSHSGSLVTGPVTIPTTDFGNGFNLISNPYASPISWTAVYNANSSVGLLGGTIYGYNADGGGVVSSYNAGAGSGGSNVIGDVIPAGQAFFIDMGAFSLCPPLPAGCSIVIDESMKVSNNTNANPVIRTTSAASNNTAMFNLKINGTTGDYDQTQFRVIPSATSNFDRRWDGYKIFQTPGYAGYPGAYTKYTTISSRMNNIDYSINSLGALTHSIAVPVLVRVSTTGSYTITASDFANYSSCIVLKDKLTNTLTDLKVSSYVFNISDTTSTPRFELLMCEEGNTTVSLTELKANSGNIQIKQDELGAFVDTHFEKNTKATISVYNVMGQQLMKDVLVEGTDTSTRLNLDAHNQVLIIKVTADKETTTKKIIAH
jgi:hypothetical protein